MRRTATSGGGRPTSTGPSTRTARATPQLRLIRLRFVGEKHLDGEEHPRAINYDQPLAPGTNVVLIEDNDVGKSSIMKTIKFALTGDDDDYDRDVKEWLYDIWLTFALDAQVWTVLISRRGGIHGAMVLGEERRLVEEALDSPAVLWDVSSQDKLKAELERFFFQRLGLSELSWTAQSSWGRSPAGVGGKRAGCAANG